MNKIIIGLGNIGNEYQDTRHNIGFMFLDFLAKKEKMLDFELDKKVEGETSKGKVKKSSVFLIKPHTFVNKSGLTVSKAKLAYKAKPENIIIVQDDLDIPFGNTKISFDRNSGGHKGIDSIIKALKTKKFYRLRIGLSTKSLMKARQESEKKRDEFVLKFVLSKFTKSEDEELKKIFKEGYDKIMNLL
mgnify:CR=1 FL=1